VETERFEADFKFPVYPDFTINPKFESRNSKLETNSKFKFPNVQNGENKSTKADNNKGLKHLVTVE